MRKYICLSFFLSFVVCNSIHAQEISIEEAYKKLVAQDNNITQKNVYYSPKTLNPKEQIAGFKPIKSPDYKAPAPARILSRGFFLMLQNTLPPTQPFYNFNHLQHINQKTSTMEKTS